jgi:3-dehydroquinate dehydratase type I
MICLTLFEKDLPCRRQILRRSAMAEIRLDRGLLAPPRLERLFAGHPRLIATCRPGILSDHERKAILERAVKAGAYGVDLDPGTDRAIIAPLMVAARRRKCRVILSHHDHSTTPTREVLLKIIRRHRAMGADIVKIACLARNRGDVARILSLYDSPGCEPGRLVALAMGALGSISRVAMLSLGAPFSYAAPDDGPPGAPGQLPLKRMQLILELLEHDHRRNR